ncbi:unnamed protein product [Timema podura]|uniref:Tumor protein D54 n=1 Tax=Timema podura TaxID=61482 RepID=A0ABN7PA87_TIMPD|nr:unnamed protein product [Timema podura]
MGTGRLLDSSVVEEEILTLRHVLASKVKQSQDLKRKLGISVWRELQDDMSQGIRNVKESNLKCRHCSLFSSYQKTESVIKTTAEKTTSLLGGLGSSVTTKLGQLKNSESFRSIEERVGTAYENVKTKVSTSRSNSMQSFDDALREAEGARKASGDATTQATSPTIPEGGTLS